MIQDWIYVRQNLFQAVWSWEFSFVALFPGSKRIVCVPTNLGLRNLSCKACAFSASAQKYFILWPLPGALLPIWFYHANTVSKKPVWIWDLISEITYIFFVSFTLWVIDLKLTKNAFTHTHTLIVPWHSCSCTNMLCIYQLFVSHSIDCVFTLEVLRFSCHYGYVIMCIFSSCMNSTRINFKN